MAITQIGKSGGTSINGPHMEIFRLKTMLSGLGLECKGIRFRGGSLYARIKREYGLKGNKQKVYDQFKLIVERECNAILSVFPADGSNDKGQDMDSEVTFWPETK